MVGPHDHLGALPGREGGFLATLLRFAFGNLVADFVHRLPGAGDVFFRSEILETLLLGEFDVDADAVGVFSGLSDEFVRGFRDGLEMDIASEVMDLAERPGDSHHLLHGEVGAAHDSRTEEEAFDVIAFVEIESQRDDLFGGEACPADVT